MKKLISLVLSVVMICCFSVTAFAVDSPTGVEKLTVTVRKADIFDPAGKVDTEYTFDVGTTITVKANSKYGKFDSWSVYKESATTPSTGMITLSVLNLAATKTEDAAQGTDYEIIKGSLTTEEMTIKLNTSVIVCGNYDNVKTDPNVSSNADGSDSAPSTGDMTVAYALVVMIAVVAFGFGVKKVYSK